MSTKVINATLVIHKVNMCSKNILLNLNLIWCHGNKRNLKCHKGRIKWRLTWFKVRLKRYNSREAEISVSLLDLNVTENFGQIRLVRNDNLADFLWMLTGKEHALGTLGRYYRHIRYTVKLVTNSSNCILINLAVL